MGITGGIDGSRQGIITNTDDAPRITTPSCVTGNLRLCIPLITPPMPPILPLTGSDTALTVAPFNPPSMVAYSIYPAWYCSYRTCPNAPPPANSISAGPITLYSPDLTSIAIRNW